MTSHGAKRPYNKAVRLRPESEDSRRVVFEIAPGIDVRWIQCHRCRSRFWYTLHEDTPNEERWEWGKRLRDGILGQACSEHPAGGEDDRPTTDDGR